MTKERILLEEPELPAVDITGPITVTDTEIEPVAEVEEVSEETTKDAFISLIANEIANNYSSIDSFKSIKSTVATSTLDDSLKEDINNIVEGIIDNRTLEIGMFQTILEQLDPDMSALIKDGKSVAEEEVKESLTEDLIVIEKDEAKDKLDTISKQIETCEDREIRDNLVSLMKIYLFQTLYDAEHQEETGSTINKEDWYKYSEFLKQYEHKEEE